MAHKSLSWGDRVGWAAFVFSVLSVAVAYLLPDERGIGVSAVILAAVLIATWYFLEIRGKVHSRIIHGLVILAIIGTAYGFIRLTKLPDCSCNLSSEIVARDYYVSGLLPGTMMIKPMFREFFYDWNLKMESPKKIRDITLVINDLEKDDRVTVSPENLAEVTELAPRWMSGFKEPSRNSDFFSKTVRFSDVTSSQELRISVRRLLGGTSLSNTQVIRLIELNSPSCVATKPNFDEAAEQKRLNDQAAYINANWPVPLGNDPGDAPSRKVIGTTEFRCDDKHRCTIGRLEARLGPPR
jgi:hypothetical protein